MSNATKVVLVVVFILAAWWGGLLVNNWMQKEFCGNPPAPKCLEETV